MHAWKSQSNDLRKFRRPHLPNVFHVARFATGLNLLSFILCLHRGVARTKCRSCKMLIFDNKTQAVNLAKNNSLNESTSLLKKKKRRGPFYFCPPCTLTDRNFYFCLLYFACERKSEISIVVEWQWAPGINHTLKGNLHLFGFEQSECAGTSDGFRLLNATWCFQCPCWFIVWNKLYLPPRCKTTRPMSLHQTRRRPIKRWSET